jgi:hypothetical protein
MKSKLENCFHLTVEIVREIHTEAIRRSGGPDGVRDRTLLESGVTAPQASSGGNSPYKDMTEVAAAQFAREQGATILEGYPVEPKRDQPDAFVYNGLASTFRKAGFQEVARRSPSRPIYRRVFKPTPPR